MELTFEGKIILIFLSVIILISIGVWIFGEILIRKTERRQLKKLEEERKN